ncbi:MAG: ABC transporter substrate-binding protein [Desulfurococcales archaeon]|nr:ABC transporter substrate-binding protein [Desulfurococcales archaeon]
MDKYRVSASLLLAFLVAVSTLPLALVLHAQSNSNWPWGSSSEPYPWLSYLKSLPHEDGVTLIVITRHEQTIQEKTREVFLKSPVAKELGIKNIIFVPAGPELWETYIKRSIEKGHPIDVAWGGGPTLFNYIDSKGYLEPLDVNAHPEYQAILYEMTKIPQEIAGVPTYLEGSDGLIHWVGAAISSFGITVNHAVLNQYNLPVPEKWDDLTKPEFAKELPSTPLVGVADPTMSTSNTRMYEIILQGYGWDEGWRILTLMAANSKIFDSSSGVRDAVILGDIAAGITIDFYGYTAMHQNPDCEYVLPKGLTIVNADPIAIIKGTKHPVQAAAFVAWVLSEYGGQQVWLDPDINRLPINPKVFDTELGQERQDLHQAYNIATSSPGIEFNETIAGLTERPMQFYFKATLVNAHDDLQSVWAEIAKAYLDGKITKDQFNQLVDALTKPFKFKDPLTGQETTFTLDYAIKISKKIGEQSIYQALMSEWEDGARQRYQEAYQLLQQFLSQPPPTTQTTTTAATTTSAQTTPGQTTAATTTHATTTAPAATTTTGQGKALSSGKIAAIVVGLLIIVVAAYLVVKK